MSLNKKYENLIIYLIGPMEDDSMAEKVFETYAQALRSSGVAEVLNPCEQEKDKTGMNTTDAQKGIQNLRLGGQNDEVDRIYKAIWKVDSENVRKSDLLIAHLERGDRYTGTSVEGTLANIPNFLDMLTYQETDEQEYKNIVRPWLKRVGWCKPVYLITTSKTRINGTFVHKLVRASGGKVFHTMPQLIEHLKEIYK